MCWLLILAKDIEKASSFKRGDIISVKPDDITWGSKEGLPAFYRIQIQDLDYLRVKAFLEQREISGIGLDRQIVRVRNHQIDLSTVPPAILNQLNSTGTVSVTKRQIRNYVKNNAGTVIDLDAING